MGTKAYAELVRKLPIYPNPRKLQMSVEHIKFRSGIQYDILHAVKNGISRLPDGHRTCVVGGNGMAIKEAEVYDPRIKKMIGKATFEPHSGLAKKAMALVIAGVATRFKFTGAYVLTSSVDKSKKRKREKYDERDIGVGEALKKLVIDLVAAEKIAGVEIEAYIRA